MGKRLHSAVKYEVKYGDKAIFNFQQEKINSLIYALAEGDCSCSHSYNGEICFSDTVFANRSILLANVDKIIYPDTNWEFQEDVDHYIKVIERDVCPIAREDIYKNLKAIIEQSDSNCVYVHFAWF